MRVHELKTWPEPFEAIRSGRKLFELRADDRGFAVGDVLKLYEWDPSPAGEGFAKTVKGYTGRGLRAEVTYVLHGGRFGLPEGMCIMSLDKVTGLL